MRLVDHPLPPYSYVPGMFPHPVSDPDGHGCATPVDSPMDPHRWWHCRVYLYGCDLFNHGYYWEAHECWEAIWHSLGRQGLLADFLKALIKLAAALVKAREGRPQGVARHAKRCRTLLELTAERCGAPSLMGLSLAQLVDAARALEATPDRFVDTRRAPALRLVPFELIPHQEPSAESDA